MQGEFNMTVKELRPMLIGPTEKVTVSVFYDSEEYDITDPRKDIPIRTLKSIERQAGLKFQ